MSTLSILAPRQREIALLVGVECLPTKEIARRLGISPRTVEVTRGDIYAKLGVTTLAQMVRAVTLAHEAEKADG